MSIVDTFMGWFGYAKAREAKPPAVMLSVADGYRYEMPDPSRAERQANLYANSSALSTAIDHIASLGMTTPYSVSRRQGGPDGDKQDIPNHAFEMLLENPNPDQSGAEFLMTCIASHKLTGNLYIYKNAVGESAPPDELWTVPPQLIEPIPDGRMYIKGYKLTPPGKAPEFIEPWRILHLKTYNPINPLVGLSPVQSLMLDAWGDIAQQKWNVSLFDKHAGKFPGILAFKHMIDGPQWNELKRTRDEDWGGTNRPPVMMLRGVGDTVQWLPAALSQKEMDFLETRRLTKEQIYEKLAPGLSSVLAINATEANSIAGKSTLIELGVWPLLVLLGAKFTQKILPLYGDGLVGAFDDIRQTNRILDLQEQQEYAKYHTVNEVRAEYYDEDPLYLDESQETALEEEQKVTAENRQMGVEMLQQAKPKPAPFGKADEPLPEAPAVAKPPAPKLPGKPGRKLDPRGLMFAAQIGPATPLPGDPTKPPPAPPMPPAPPPTGQADADKPPEKDDAPAKAAELEAWERFAVKRLGKGGRDFEPRVLDVFTAGRIRTALKAAGSEADVRAVFARERVGGDGLAEAVAELKRFNDIARPH